MPAHVDSFYHDRSREGDAPGVVHALGGWCRRRSYQASTARGTDEGHRRALTGKGHYESRLGSKRSSLAGDAREHPAMDDEAPEVRQVQEVC
jgi:hypothetical protein